MATLLINLNLWGSKFFSLTKYFRLGGYQNSHRYVKFGIQMKEQIVEMLKMDGMVAQS